MLAEKTISITDNMKNWQCLISLPLFCNAKNSQYYHFAILQNVSEATKLG